MAKVPWLGVLLLNINFVNLYIWLINSFLYFNNNLRYIERYRFKILRKIDLTVRVESFKGLIGWNNDVIAINPVMMYLTNYNYYFMHFTIHLNNMAVLVVVVLLKLYIKVDNIHRLYSANSYNISFNIKELNMTIICSFLVYTEYG